MVKPREFSTAERDMRCGIAAMGTRDTPTDLRWMPCSRFKGHAGPCAHEPAAPAPAPAEPWEAIARYHAEHAGYGGASWEFHARAETFCRNALETLHEKERLYDLLTEWERAARLITPSDVRPEMLEKYGKTLVRQAGEAAEHLGVIEQLRAEVEMLRGVGCDEDGDGPCGVCLKCARRERDEARAEVRAAHSREHQRPFTPDHCRCSICTEEKKT